jgi:short-subunit dehydrogenase
LINISSSQLFIAKSIKANTLFMKDLNTYWKENLAGKRVLITGGSTGIGREITILLSSFGASCLICARNQEPIDETILATDNMCIGLTADISKPGDIERVFQAVDKELGGIDILINNAALGYGSATEGEHEDINYIIHTNLTAYLSCSQQASKRMEVDGKGHIVNIGSMSADVREKGSSVYVATKAGIQGFSAALRKELNPKGIKVTLIEPGATDTDMQTATGSEKKKKVQNQEMLTAEDVAMAVGFCLVQPQRCDIVSLQIRPHLQLI